MTPASLADILYSNSEREKDLAAIRDLENWQLGQYIGSAIVNAFSKTGNTYPQKPIFAFKQAESSESSKSLTKAQQDLETLKFQEFFNNLGSYVTIKKKKGGLNGKK